MKILGSPELSINLRQARCMRLAKYPKRKFLSAHTVYANVRRVRDEYKTELSRGASLKAVAGRKNELRCMYTYIYTHSLEKAQVVGKHKV